MGHRVNACLRRRLPHLGALIVSVCAITSYGAFNINVSGTETINVNAGSPLTVDSININSSLVNGTPTGSTLIKGGSGALAITTALNIGSTVNSTWVPGTLDFQAGELVFKNGNAGTGGAQINTTGTLVAANASRIRTLIKAGADAGWANTTGITSSTVRTDNTTGSGLKAIGTITGQEYMDTSEVSATSISGLTVAATDVLAKVTYYGDANLDGQITATDYTLIDNGYTFGISGSGWLSGDFDYSGTVDATDYTLIDNAYTFQSGVLAVPLLEAHAAMLGTAYTSGLSAQALALLDGSAVPEPASLGLLALGALGLLSRRKR